MLLPMTRDWSGGSGEDAASYYRDILRTAGFKELCQVYVFARVTQELNTEFPVFLVEEIGYKLSKRKEKARPNQMCLFRGKKTKTLITNLHLAEEEYEVLINKASPQTVLEMMRNSVVWR